MLHEDIVRGSFERSSEDSLRASGASCGRIPDEASNGSNTNLGYLLALGDTCDAVALFRRRIRELIANRVAPLVPAAESNREFPREAVAAFGEEGLYRERWTGPDIGDLGKSVIIAEEMGSSGIGGVGVGVSLHLEAAIGVLRRFARTPFARSILDQAMAGEIVTCVATSERDVGSDLSAVTTELRPEGSGWRLRGTKWFVSPGAAADVAIVLCRASNGLNLAIVPREGLVVAKRLKTAGMRGLGTSRLEVDASVPADAVLCASGSGLYDISTGLATERLAIAAFLLGCSVLALRLTIERMRERKQFGVPLYRHQALRLRIADLASQVKVVRYGVYSAVAQMTARQSIDMRDVAGLKVVAARLAERVVGECIHVFGGHGYIEDETILPRLWRDLRIGRVGGGTDEMMLELVAAGMHRDISQNRSAFVGG